MKTYEQRWSDKVAELDAAMARYQVIAVRLFDSRGIMRTELVNDHNMAWDHVAAIRADLNQIITEYRAGS